MMVEQEALEGFRTALSRERSSLRQQIKEEGADPDDPRSLGVDFEGGFADSAHTSTERARLMSLLEGLRQILADVDHALAKIEAGSGFGVCERCGKEISVERLEAISSARLCIECKQKLG